MLKARVTRVGLNEKTRTPVIILHVEEEGGILPIAVGKAEAKAIALALKGVMPPRPIAYDLMKSIVDNLNINVEKVRVTTLHEGTFYAELDIQHNGSSLSLDSRPSDAIALALRAGAPIYISESVAEKAVVEESRLETESTRPGGHVDEERRQFRKFLEKVRPEDFGDLDEFER